MGVLTMGMGFLKFDRVFVYVSAVILTFYAFYFYSQGYGNGLFFLIWAGAAVVANIFVKKKPLVAYASLLVISFVMYYTLRYLVEAASQAPHSQILTTLLVVMVGATIDSLYWVYKYDNGKKFKTNYDE
jgi:hypothetical protein